MLRKVNFEIPSDKYKTGAEPELNLNGYFHQLTPDNEAAIIESINGSLIRIPLGWFRFSSPPVDYLEEMQNATCDHINNLMIDLPGDLQFDKDPPIIE